MNWTLTCPACGQSRAQSDDVLGRKVRCPACRSVFRVTSSDLKPVIEPRSRAAVRPIKTAASKRANLPAWAYGALGFGAALALFGVIVVTGSFKRPPPVPLGEPAVAVVRAEATPQPAQKPAPPKVQIAATGTPPVTPAKVVKLSPERPREVVVAQGKKAAAFVEVSFPGGAASGTAFCVDKSGLFVTNKHVVNKAVEPSADLHLLIDSGQETQRRLPAKVLRADDSLDLALLKIDADPRLTTLELGRDETLSQTAQVVTFGFPLGKGTRVGHETYPPCTVIMSKITKLHREKERLGSVQFDGQLNPGNSGGPVVNASGEVVGVAVKTIEGESTNFAIPVGRLSDFMAAPGVSFQPPILSYEDRYKPVSWFINLEPPTPASNLPEGLSVQVTIAHSKEDRRTAEAKAAPDGTCKVEIIPVPRDPRVPVKAIEALVEAKKGTEVLATIYRRIELQGAPRRPEAKVANDGAEAQFFVLRRLPGYGGGPFQSYVAAPVTVTIRPVVPGVGPSDDGLLTVKGTLDVNGQRRGAGGSIRPPTVPMGEARIGPSFGALREVRRLPFEDGNKDALYVRRALDLAASPDGRRLVAGTVDGKVRVWDATSGRRIHVLSAHKREVNVVAISPDGRRALSAGDGKVLRLWDIDSGELLHEYVDRDGRDVNDYVSIDAVAFTGDGRRALSAGRGWMKEIWARDLDTGKVVARWSFQGGSDYVPDIRLAVSPDGRFVLSSFERSVRLFDVETGRGLADFRRQDDLTRKAVFSPDSQTVIVASNDGPHLIRVLDAPTGRELRGFGHPDIFLRTDYLAVSPDGRILISGGTGGNQSFQRFRVWEVGRGQLLGTTEAWSGGHLLVGAITPDGRRLFWHESAGSITEYAAPEPLPERDRTAPGTCFEPLVRRLSSPIEDLAVGGGGRYLCLKLKGTALAIFDVNAAEVIKTIWLDSENALIAAGADCLVAAYLDHVPATLERWNFGDLDAAGMKVLLPIRGRIKALAMGSDSDGPLLVAWAPYIDEQSADDARFSFLEAKTLAVLKAGPITNVRIKGGFPGKWGGVSPSGGSMVLDGGSYGDRLRLRASAGGNQYGIWEFGPAGSPNQREQVDFFQTLGISGASLKLFYQINVPGPAVPGPDGRTVYGGRGAIRDSEGKPVGPADKSTSASMIFIPSPDPAYYLGVEAEHAIVYATEPSSGLFSVLDLDEMAPGADEPPSDPSNFTFEKRFHLIPAANLLITIPYTNDKLVLRRLDIAATVRQAQGAKPTKSSTSTR
jgi:S1-C subfamily serine protease